jgi:hypothetical protein
MASKIGAVASEAAFGHIKMISACTLVFKTGARILQLDNRQRVPGNSEIELLGHKLPHRNLYPFAHQCVYGGYERSAPSLAATANALSRLAGLRRKL